MTKSGPPTSLEPSEYEAIEKAMMETSRGRWFLAQFAEKNRRQDTQVVLEAIEKLESSVAGARSQPEADRIKTDLVEMSKAIERTRNEIANLKLPDQEGGNLVGATEELDAIVSATERATNKILQAAEDIQETAWIIREDGGSIDASCARIDTDVTDIYTACSFQDITGQRTQKVVQILTYLESRINAMVSIWGLATDDNSSDNSGSSDAQHLEEEKRPDAHLLNGPQMEDEALKQHHIDDVMAESENQDQQQSDTERFQMDDATSTDMASEQNENHPETLDSTEETALELQEDQQIPLEDLPETTQYENSQEEEETPNADNESLDSETLEAVSVEPQLSSELEQPDEPEQQSESQTIAKNEVIEEELSGLEENLLLESKEEEALAENILSDLEEIATSAVEENLSIPEPQITESEEILEQTDEVTDTLLSEASDIPPESAQELELQDITETEDLVHTEEGLETQETDDNIQEQVILDHIENANLLPEDEEIKETILAEDTPLNDDPGNSEETTDERAAFEQHFKKISEELQKAKQLKEQTETEHSAITEQSHEQVEEIETGTSLQDEETVAIGDQDMQLDEIEQTEEVAAEDQADQEIIENQESMSEADEQEEEKTAEELRKLSSDKKSALFQ